MTDLFVLWIILAFCAILAYSIQVDALNDQLQPGAAPVDFSWVVFLGLVLTAPITGTIVLLKFGWFLIKNIIPYLVTFALFLSKNAFRSIGLAFSATTRRSTL